MGSLEEVHMPQNGINHPGVTALATAMQHNTRLRILNLNDNTFTDKGAIAMAQVLRRRGLETQQNHALIHSSSSVWLLLYKSVANNICTSQALKYLHSIQVINFGDCLVRTAGAKAIAETVLEGLPILKVSERCSVSTIRCVLSLPVRIIERVFSVWNSSSVHCVCCIDSKLLLNRNSICHLVRLHGKLDWRWLRQ